MDPVDRRRREAERNLVQQQENGVGQQRPPNRHRLLFAPGERAGPSGQTGSEVWKDIQHCRHVPGPGAAGGACQAQIFRHRHVGE